MLIDKKKLLVIVTVVFVNLLSCSHNKQGEQLQRMSRKIKTSDYTLRADYKCTTPGNDIIIYKINDWNQWFIPKSIKDYGKPEWLIKRKDIQLQEISGRSYTSIDGSYEISLPFLSSKKVYFSDTFIPHNRESQFVLIDENDWAIGIETSEIMKDPYYTDYYEIRSPDEVMSLVGRLGQGHAGEVVSQNYGKYIPIITKYFNYDGILIFEEYVRCAGSLDSPENIVNSISYGKCTTIKHLKRQLVKNGYLYAISVYVECKSENEDECHTHEKVYELSDYILKNIKFQNKDGD